MTPLIAVAASNDEVAELSDDAKLADLMNRLVEYESFTEEEKQMVDKAAAFCECLPVCDCEPEHECWPSGMYYESNHPHRQYYWGCEDGSCNYSGIKYYTGHNGYSGSCSICNPPHSHSWYNSGSPSPTHTSSGHAQTQRCSCGSTRTVYVAKLSGCTTCYPHSHSWQNSGSPSNTHNYNYGGHAQIQSCFCGQTKTVYIPFSTCAICYPDENFPIIRFVVDDAAFAEYNNNLTGLFSVTYNALKAYDTMWDITWTRHVFRSSGMLPYDACGLPSYVECYDWCSTNCSEHHKNAIRNLEWMANNNNLLGTADFYHAITATPLCTDFFTGVHTVYGGMAYVGGLYGTSGTNSSNLTWSTRVIQHELAHNFGCSEESCAPNQRCIMGTGFNSNYDWNIFDIWCDNCEADFNRDIYK